jgi:hypothetical protein
MDEVIVNVTEQTNQVVVNIQEQTTPLTLDIQESPQLVTLNITENPSDVNVNIVENKQEVMVSVIDYSSGSNSGSDSFYQHNQMVPSSSWIVNHNLSKFPSVTIVDSAGTMVMGDVLYNSENQVTITFGAAFAGKAYFN